MRIGVSLKLSFRKYFKFGIVNTFYALYDEFKRKKAIRLIY